jgi:hypothetical protein
VGANLALHNDQQIVGGATYLYRIVAFNIYGESLASNEARAIAPTINATPLLNGRPIGRSVTRTRPAFFSIEVPVGSNQLSIELSGSGNVDLYVRAGEPPQIDRFDCRSNKLNSLELCVIPFPTPGTWYILVVGNSPTLNNFSILATHRGGISLTRAQISAKEPRRAILPPARKRILSPTERPAVRRNPLPWG